MNEICIKKKVCIKDKIMRFNNYVILIDLDSFIVSDFIYCTTIQLLWKPKVLLSFGLIKIYEIVFQELYFVVNRRVLR